MFLGISECLWDIKALNAFVYTTCVCVCACKQTSIHTPLCYVKEQGLFTHHLCSSETGGMCRPAQGGTVAPPTGRLAATPLQTCLSLSVSSPEASAHLDSCHAKTGLSQNHTPSVFLGIGVSGKSLFPIPRCKTRTSGGFYLQIDLIKMPVTLLA